MKAMHMVMQEGESNEDWKKKMESMFTIVEQFGGSLSNHPGLIEKRAMRLQPQTDEMKQRLTRLTERPPRP